MWLLPIATGHPTAPLVQPTWHCLQRFRERSRQTAGLEALLIALQETLQAADITALQPAGVRYRQAWDLWAINGQLAFPLVETAEGWIIPTCLPINR